MDVRLVNPVLESMLNVLSTMANMTPQVGKPTLKSSQTSLGDVSGIMSMVSPQVRASLAISFTTPVICDIVKRMLGDEINEVNDSARDLTGEMTNMVVGGAKNIFVKQGYDFNMTSPSILTGKDHMITHQFKGKTIVLPFTTDSGMFYVEICFEEKTGK